MTEKIIRHKKRICDHLSKILDDDSKVKFHGRTLILLKKYGFIKDPRSLSTFYNITDEGREFYKKYYTSENEKLIKRFFSKVEKSNTCWIWKAHTTPNGYGHFHYIKKDILAHRFSYELHKDKIPKGLLVCHTCDNRLCVNPDHLWIGTDKNNSDDCIKKKRKKMFGISEAKKGSENINSKLKTEDVLGIKKQLNLGYTCSKLSKQYNVTYLSIYNIKNNKTWKHI